MALTQRTLRSACFYRVTNVFQGANDIVDIAVRTVPGRLRLHKLRATVILKSIKFESANTFATCLCWLQMTYEWLHGKPRVSKMKIANNLAPPLKIYADKSDIVLTTIDSILGLNSMESQQTF